MAISTLEQYNVKYQGLTRELSNRTGYDYCNLPRKQRKSRASSKRGVYDWHSPSRVWLNH